MKSNESEEMYLETILLLKKKNINVRSLDIAETLGYSKPSISRAMKLLKNKEYISISNDGTIEFTDVGYKKATDIYNRHSILKKFLIKIGASVELAEENACRIEHIIDQELLKIIKNYLDNYT